MTLSWKALGEVHDHFAQVAGRVCREGAGIAPQLFLLKVSDTGAIEQLSALPQDDLRFFFSSSSSRKTFARFLRAVLTTGSDVQRGFTVQMGFEPNVLVQLNEAWVARVSSDAELAAYTVGALQPSDVAQSEEAVVVALHYDAGSVEVLHPLRRGMQRSLDVRPFPTQREALLVANRFTVDAPLRPVIVH